MKANEAPDFPEKVYIPRDPEYPQSPDIWWERESSESNIEYTRTDAFIDKAMKFLKEWDVYRVCLEGHKDWFIEQFKNYMKGE